ncbi:MAG: PAS domain S-box protein [Pyrinomonadaceae bacterium]
MMNSKSNRENRETLPVKILLIDDGSGSVSRIQQLLSTSDFPSYQLDSVATLIAAAANFRRNLHDVCIIDSAKARTKDFLVEATRVGCTTPLIIVSSDNADEVLSAFENGASDCLIRDHLNARILEQSICKAIEGARVVSLQRENERRYRGLIDNARDIVYTHDLEGNYTSANRAAERISGYTLEEILKLNIKSVIVCEDLITSQEMIERKLLEQKETTYEVDMITKDGRRVPVEVNSHLIYEAGIPVAVQGIARDISERRRADSALRKSEERYRELFENANDIIYIHDLEGNFKTLNEAAEFTTGYSREEALRMNIVQVIAPDYLETALAMITHKAQPEAPTVYELDIINKSGQRLSLEVSTRVVFDDGRAVGIQGIGRDITERKRSELERRVILEIIQSVTHTSNLAELLQLAHQALGKILYAENCFVALKEPETGNFTMPLFVDKVFEPVTLDNLMNGLTAYVFRTGEPLLSGRDVFNRLVDEGEVELVGNPSPSWLGVPIKTPSATIGVLVVQNYEEKNVYSVRDLEFLTSVGGQIALAIERKRSEQALKKSEEEYRDIFDNATMGIYRSTRDGRLITANRELARMLGYSSIAELLQCNLVTDVYCDPNERARCIAEQSRTGSAEGLHVLWKKKDRTQIWVQLSAIAILDENGDTTFFDGFVHDVTEHKAAERALRESEERYQRLVELSPDGIIVHTDGIISFINGSGVRLIGAPTAASLVDKSVYEFIDPSQRQRFVDRVKLLQQGEILPPVEIMGKRIDGTEVHCEVMSVPFTNMGRPAVQVVVRDITERKLAELALEEANVRAIADYEQLVERIAVLGQTLGNARELRAILRAVKDFTTVSVPCDGIVITLHDQEKSVRGAVYSWPDDTEFDTEEATNMPVGDGVTGQLIESNSTVVNNDYERPAGANMSAQIGDRNLENAPRFAMSDPMIIMGRTVGCIEIYSYVSQAYREEHRIAMRMAASLVANAVENVALMDREQEKVDQLRQSQKMEAVGQLAGGVAHDFNNLLTAITGYCDIGLRRVGDNDGLRKNLQEIKRAGERAASLTRQLLAFSRKQMLQAKVIDLNSIVGDLDRMLQRLIGEDIDLVTLLDAKPCRVKADPGQIEQVILNLVVNARDAMPRGGKLTVETARVSLDAEHARTHVGAVPGEYVLLAVSDTGTGISPEIQKRVFEPFFSTKEMGKGTGLGLSTVHGIVNQSGGTVWLYSEIDRGSTFKVYLPVVANPAEAVEPKQTSPEVRQGHETILLVEDEEMVRNLSCEILESHGYRVLTAANGEEASRLCDVYTGTIDLMITDVVMPQMSGRELAELVESKRPRMPVLYMSGYTDDAIVRHGVLEDSMPFLQKPFMPEALARKVRESLTDSVVEVVRPENN